jgi:cytochrome c
MIRGFLAVALVVVAAQPASARTAEEVQSLMARAVDYIHEHGEQEAFAEFNRRDGQFVDGELYVFCGTAAGIEVANGGNPKLVGKDLSSFRDAEGRSMIAEIYQMAHTKGQGWYEYVWPNPTERKLQRKVAYVVQIDDQTFCASGYYKPDQP